MALSDEKQIRRLMLQYSTITDVYTTKTNMPKIGLITASLCCLGTIFAGTVGVIIAGLIAMIITFVWMIEVPESIGSFISKMNTLEQDKFAILLQTVIEELHYTVDELLQVDAKVKNRAVLSRVFRELNLPLLYNKT